MRIVYIGLKPTKSDNVAQTGLTWVRGEILEVADEKKAAKLLEFPSVWADADKPYELAKLHVQEISQPKPQVAIVPENELSPFWEPVTIPVSAEEFHKLRLKELVPVFMAGEEAEQYKAWQRKSKAIIEQMEKA